MAEVDKAVMRVSRFPARLGAALICLIGSGMVAVAPAEAAPGFAAQLSGLPDRFAAGAGPATVSAVVSRSAGGDCLKVRWSLVVRVRDLRLDQVRVERIEDDGSFPVEVQTQDGVARITDVQFDPGTLCRDRTVTARYRIAFAGDTPTGRVTLSVEALDPGLRPLAEASASRSVTGARAPAAPPPAAGTEPDPTATAAVEEPTALPTEDPSLAEPSATEPTGGVAAGEGAGTGQADRSAASGGIGAVQAGFLLGGLLLFLGVGLLLRLRRLVREPPAKALAPAGPWDRSARSRRRTVRR